MSGYPTGVNPMTSQCMTGCDVTITKLVITCLFALPLENKFWICSVLINLSLSLPGMSMLKNIFENNFSYIKEKLTDIRA